jgi:hypothetical protein
MKYKIPKLKSTDYINVEDPTTPDVYIIPKNSTIYWKGSLGVYVWNTKEDYFEDSFADGGWGTIWERPEGEALDEIEYSSEVKKGQVIYVRRGYVRIEN